MLIVFPKLIFYFVNSGFLQFKIFISSRKLDSQEYAVSISYDVNHYTTGTS